ncbi:MAG: SAM-dependent methyltransferase [Pseudonocardiales bacterium]|nr:SAM-dependent methyltransferase [Pseudonocardiales bacterium]
MAELFSSDQPAAARLNQISSLLNPWAIRTAVTMRLPDLVANGADTTSELASQSGADLDALGRLMRHLTFLGLFRTTAAGCWEVAELGEILRDGHPMRIAMDQADDFVRKVDQSIYGLLDAVRTGGAVWERLHGRSFWKELAFDSEIGRSYNFHMAVHAAMFGPALAQSYDWSTVQHLVDVGGGTGHTLATIMSAHPHLRGTLIDLPDPVASATAILEAANVGSRCVVAAQSFFDTLPSGGDVYLLANIIHGWSDGESIKILQRCADAAGSGGRVLLVERVIAGDADETVQAAISHLDLCSLLLFGGRERSEEEFRQLCTTAGLRQKATHALTDCPWLSLMEFVVED